MRVFIGDRSGGGGEGGRLLFFFISSISLRSFHIHFSALVHHPHNLPKTKKQKTKTTAAHPHRVVSQFANCDVSVFASCGLMTTELLSLSYLEFSRVCVEGGGGVGREGALTRTAIASAAAGSRGGAGSVMAVHMRCPQSRLPHTRL